MEELYSKIKKDVLLHVINKGADCKIARINLTPDDKYLQVGVMRMHAGKAFRAHKHVENIRTTNITQESWIIIKGKVKAFLYDLDDNILAIRILEQGDCSITFKGGHTYECLEDDTLVYEYKTGPYKGIEKDKVFLKEQ